MHQGLEAIWLMLPGGPTGTSPRPEPWVLRKSDAEADQERFRPCSTTLEAVRIAAVLVQPVMPTQAGRLLDLLGQPSRPEDFAALSRRLTPGTELPTPFGGVSPHELPDLRVSASRQKSPHARRVGDFASARGEGKPSAMLIERLGALGGTADVPQSTPGPPAEPSAAALTGEMVPAPRRSSPPGLQTAPVDPAEVFLVTPGIAPTRRRAAGSDPVGSGSGSRRGQRRGSRLPRRRWTDCVLRLDRGLLSGSKASPAQPFPAGWQRPSGDTRAPGRMRRSPGAHPDPAEHRGGVLAAWSDPVRRGVPGVRVHPLHQPRTGSPLDFFADMVDAPARPGGLPVRNRGAGGLAVTRTLPATDRTGWYSSPIKGTLPLHAAPELLRESAKGRRGERRDRRPGPHDLRTGRPNRIGHGAGTVGRAPALGVWHLCRRSRPSGYRLPESRPCWPPPSTGIGHRDAENARPATLSQGTAPTRGVRDNRPGLTGGGWELNVAIRTVISTRQRAQFSVMGGIYHRELRPGSGVAGPPAQGSADRAVGSGSLAVPEHRATARPVENAAPRVVSSPGAVAPGAAATTSARKPRQAMAALDQPRHLERPANDVRDRTAPEPTSDLAETPSAAHSRVRLRCPTDLLVGAGQLPAHHRDAAPAPAAHWRPPGSRPIAG